MVSSPSDPSGPLLEAASKAARRRWEIANGIGPLEEYSPEELLKFLAVRHGVSVPDEDEDDLRSEADWLSGMNVVEMATLVLGHLETDVSVEDEGVLVYLSGLLAEALQLIELERKYNRSGSLAKS